MEHADTAEPKLGQPGAGLPKLELTIARLLFGFKRRLGSRESFDAHFTREREAIRALFQACSAESGLRRVLIRRPAGLEDSSRYWSVWMTLDHLRIVNSAIAQTISHLAKGVTPPGKVSTAAVKPTPDATIAVVTPFEESCDAVLKAVASWPNLHTGARLEHPWFGPLDAFGWHALAAGHMSIHRVQVGRILAGLP